MDVKNRGWGRQAEGPTGKPKAGGAARQGKEVSQEEVEGSGTRRSKSIWRNSNTLSLKIRRFHIRSVQTSNSPYFPWQCPMLTAVWGERSFKYNGIQEGRGARLKEKKPSEWVWYFCFWSRYLWTWPGRQSWETEQQTRRDRRRRVLESGLQWESNKNLMQSSSVSQLWENRCLNLHLVDVVVHSYTPSTQDAVTGDLDVKHLVIHIHEYSYTWHICVWNIYIYKLYIHHFLPAWIW